jgi:hypothetical protein
MRGDALLDGADRVYIRAPVSFGLAGRTAIAVRPRSGQADPA